MSCAPIARSIWGVPICIRICADEYSHCSFLIFPCFPSVRRLFMAFYSILCSRLWFYTMVPSLPRSFAAKIRLFPIFTQILRSFTNLKNTKPIPHRIHGAAIYGNIYHQYTPNVSIYSITMDPMGFFNGFVASNASNKTQVTPFRTQVCKPARWRSMWRWRLVSGALAFCVPLWPVDMGFEWDL